MPEEGVLIFKQRVRQGKAKSISKRKKYCSGGGEIAAPGRGSPLNNQTRKSNAQQKKKILIGSAGEQKRREHPKTRIHLREQKKTQSSSRFKGGP